MWVLLFFLFMFCCLSAMFPHTVKHVIEIILHSSWNMLVCMGSFQYVCLAAYFTFVYYTTCLFLLLLKVWEEFTITYEHRSQLHGLALAQHAEWVIHQWQGWQFDPWLRSRCGSVIEQDAEHTCLPTGEHTVYTVRLPSYPSLCSIA